MPLPYKKRIYFDNNATTALDPRVLEAMLQDLSSVPANPSSVHFFGQEAKKRLSLARARIATFLKVKASEIFFTSGGTESINLFLRGFFAFSKGHIITSNIEHSSIFNTVAFLEKQGCSATYLSAGPWGAVTKEQVEEAIGADTRLIALAAVNSETGVKTDIEAIAELAEKYSIPFFVDGVALLGKELFSIPQGVKGMAFSAHKLHGPKGIGFLWLKENQKLEPLITGGDQEYGRRSGTENLSGILGLATAVDLLIEELPEATLHMQKLRDHFENSLLSSLDNVTINGEGPRIANTSNLSFHGIEGEELLINLDLATIAASHGSACSSGALEPSRVLLNMGLPRERARSALRFSFSRFTTKDEVDEAILIICSLVQRLR